MTRKYFSLQNTGLILSKLALMPLGGEGIRGKNFWETLQGIEDHGGT
jgi:hypothetical protein